MDTKNGKSIVYPKNEFPQRKQELFNLYLKMPVEFKEDWKLFKRNCIYQGYEFEDVIGNLIIQFNSGEIQFEKN